MFANNNCFLCHAGSPGQGGLGELDDFDQGHAEILDVVECATSAFNNRVVPGDAGSSFLVAKITNAHDCGQVMPTFGSLVSPEELAKVTSWIEAGALKN